MIYSCVLALVLIFFPEGHSTTQLCLNQLDNGNDLEFLSPNEIRVFMDHENLDRKLTEIAVTLVPEDEMHASPYHQYVNSAMFFEDANMELLKSVAQDFVEYSPEMLYCKIYNDFLVDLVTKVLNSRNKVLAAKQKTRENQLQKICLSKIEKHLENSNIVEHVDGIGELDRAISEIIESSDVHDVKKVLSYPVVRDEINRAFKEGNRGDRYGAVLSAIAPFVLEGIQIAEQRNTSKQSTDNALQELYNALLTPLVQSITDRIQMARRFYHLINQKIIHNPHAAAEFHDTIAVYLYRSINYILYHSPTTLYKTILGDNKTYLMSVPIANKIKKITLTSYFRLPHKYLMQLTESSIPGINLKNALDRSPIEVFNKAQKTLLMNSHEAMMDRYEAYVTLQRKFSEKYRLTLIDMAREMLKKDYADLKSSDFTKIDDSIHWSQDTSVDKKLKRYQPIHGFNNELEKHALSLCGFPVGSFTYSKAYLSVMQAIFPSIPNPYENDPYKFIPFNPKSISERKDEL